LFYFGDLTLSFLQFLGQPQLLRTDILHTFEWEEQLAQVPCGGW
jgi:hypothetical protein